MPFWPSSGGAGLLQMIIRWGRPLATNNLEGPASCKWSSRKIAFFMCKIRFRTHIFRIGVKKQQKIKICWSTLWTCVNFAPRAPKFFVHIHGVYSVSVLWNKGRAEQSRISISDKHNAVLLCWSWQTVLSHFFIWIFELDPFGSAVLYKLCTTTGSLDETVLFIGQQWLPLVGTESVWGGTFW